MLMRFFVGLYLSFYCNITSLLMDFAHFVNCITGSFVLKCTQLEMNGISSNFLSLIYGYAFRMACFYDFFSSIQ